MMKKVLAMFIAILVVMPMFSLAFASPVLAEIITEDDAWGKDYTNKTADQLAASAGLNTKDPREIAANVVNVILGFLGIIAVVLILIGGFMWMTSQGSEEKTGTAKKIMSAGVIGLVIVLAAFGIAKFVISAMLTATT